MHYIIPLFLNHFVLWVFFFQYFIFLKIAGTFCKNWQKMTLYNRVSYFFSFIGEYAIQEMFERCLRYMISRNKRADDDNKSTMPFAPEKTGQPAGPGASGIGIFPGTKWCGLGNEADTYADLGCYFFCIFVYFRCLTTLNFIEMPIFMWTNIYFLLLCRINF